MRCVTVFMYLLLEVLQSLERNLDLSNMCASSLLFKTKLGFVHEFMIESFVWVILTDETKVCLVV